jgi:hypothetical protein
MIKHQNNAPDGKAYIRTVEKNNADTYTPNANPSNPLDKQKPPTDLNEDTLNIIAGAAWTDRLSKFVNTEFGKTSTAGLASIGVGLASYEATKAIRHAVNNNTHN